MVVSSSLFDAYLECSTKCWLRSRAEPNAGNTYADWCRQRRETYCVDGLKRLLIMFPKSDRAIAPPISKFTKDATWRLALGVHSDTNGLETHLPAIERIPSEGRATPVQFIPYRFEFANKLRNLDKLSLAFDARVLSEALGREVTLGKIIHGTGYATLRVKAQGLHSSFTF